MNQKVLFISTLFNSKQTSPVMVGISDKYDSSIKMDIEVLAGRTLAFRVHLENGDKTLWGSFSNIDEIANYFRMASLV